MADKLVCLICQAKRPRNNCHVVKLTVEERHLLRQEGREILEEYPYCLPCWRMISDPVSGPALLKGLAQAHLRGLGVSNAEELATNYYNGLLKLSKRS